MMKTVVLLSGGIDSTTLLYYMRAKEHEVVALSVDYGQRHAVELVRASEIARLAKVEHRIFRGAEAFAQIFAGSSSSQVNPSIPVPEGHYEEESMKTTIVPNRNMVLISIAGALAEAIKADYVAYAAHAGDHAIYPDCRPEFYSAADTALHRATGIFLVDPFIKKTKAEIVALGSDLEVPFAVTYSCYKGELKHCGVCGTCTERKEAFELSNVPDPTQYLA